MRTASNSPAKLTYRDFLAFPDDGKRHELIDGVHYVTPSPVSPHQRILGNLFFLVRSHLERHGGGDVYLSPLDVVFTMFDIVEPDLLFISNARTEILTHENIQGSPDLVVEILSPSTRRRDEGVKLALYDRSDVIEYWVVDPVAQLIRIYRRRHARLARIAEMTRDRDDVLTTSLLPGMRLPLAKVFG